ncbi:MAG: oligosaccharide flippase family protein [Candidatus Zixiibacteriota bacterium]|nr:MAG: oligosaccharide flippase family protein [candidate division Zixibacteria bacterium]
MKKAIQQASILTFSNGFSKILAMLFLVVLTRLVTVNEYGLFRYMLNLASLLSALLGISTSLAKFLGEMPNDIEIRKVYLTNSLSIAGLLYLILLIISWIFYEHYMIFCILLFGVMFESFYLGFSRGLLNIKKLSIFRPVKYVLQLTAIGIAVIISSDIGILEAALFFSLSALVSSFILEIHKREVDFGYYISIDIVKRIVKYIIPITLGTAGWSVLLGVNPIIIERFCGTESVAYYSAAITLMQVFVFLPEAVSTMILPKVARAQDKSRIIRPFLLGIAGTIAINVFILIAVYLFRERIIIVLFSRDYLNAASIVLLLAIGQISLITHQLFASFWQGLGRPGIPSITISIGCVINVIGSIILTKSYGIWGASLSYAISTFCSLLLITIHFLIKKNSVGRL